MRESTDLQVLALQWGAAAVSKTGEKSMKFYMALQNPRLWL